MWSQIIQGALQFDFSWRDIIDIAIVTYVFYRIILLIRGTRAEQLVKGLVILLLAMVASGILGLRALNYLLRSAMTVSLIAIPIVFQPELRRALEQLGRGKFFQRTSFLYKAEDFEHMVNEILKAIDVFIKKRFGALIIIERETGLGDIVETGIKVEGLVTAELLVNIFMPRSPLHDGAVVVRGDQIVAAGCYLPLTDNPNLSKELGTRHRAGLGITEHSDAVAIILSEETGVISLAHEGKLTRYLDEKTLKQMLYDLCVPETSGFNFWPWRSSS